MVGGGDPFYPSLSQPAHVGAKLPIFTDISHGVSAVTPSQKNSINTNRKSAMRVPMSLR